MAGARKKISLRPIRAVSLLLCALGLVLGPAPVCDVDPAADQLARLGRLRIAHKPDFLAQPDMAPIAMQHAIFLQKVPLLLQWLDPGEKPLPIRWVNKRGPCVRVAHKPLRLVAQHRLHILAHESGRISARGVARKNNNRAG